MLIITSITTTVTTRTSRTLLVIYLKPPPAYFHNCKYRPVQRTTALPVDPNLVLSPRQPCRVGGQQRLEPRGDSRTCVTSALTVWVREMSLEQGGHSPHRQSDEKVREVILVVSLVGVKSVRKVGLNGLEGSQQWRGGLTCNTSVIAVGGT